MNICGHEYKVSTNMPKDIRRVSDNFHYGQINYVKKLIYISPEIDQKLAEESLTHEVVHGILFHTNDCGAHNEQLVNSLSCELSRMGVGKLLWKLAFPKRRKRGVPRAAKT